MGQHSTHFYDYSKSSKIMENYIKSFFPETQPVEIPTNYELVRVLTESIANSDAKYIINRNAEVEHKWIMQVAEDLGINLPKL